MKPRKYLLTYLLTAGLLAFGQDVEAQNIHELYISHQQPGGTLYHVRPLTLFGSDKDEDFVCDMTYVQGSDSITVNFTYIQPSVTLSDSVRFLCGSSSFGGKVQKLYVEAEKMNRWIHRYSLRCPVDPLYTFFQADKEAGVSVYAGQKCIAYAPKKGVWKKMAPRISSVLEMFRLTSAH